MERFVLLTLYIEQNCYRTFDNISLYFSKYAQFCIRRKRKGEGGRLFWGYTNLRNGFLKCHSWVDRGGGYPVSFTNFEFWYERRERESEREKSEWEIRRERRRIKEVEKGERGPPILKGKGVSRQVVILLLPPLFNGHTYPSSNFPKWNAINNWGRGYVLYRRRGWKFAATPKSAAKSWQNSSVLIKQYW